MSTKMPTKDVFVAGEPRVQLLPPSVRLREKNRETRRLLVLLIVLALAVVGGGMTWGYARSFQAAIALSEAQDRTAELLAQQAEYADAARMAGLVAVTEEAQRMLTAGEVDWAAVMADLKSYAPAEAQFTGATLTAPAPWEPDLVPEGPLRAQRVATVELMISSASYANAAAFVAAVRLNPVVADVTIKSSTSEGAGYITTVSLTLNSTVLKSRFDDSDDPATAADPLEGSTETDESESEPTPAPSATEGADE